MLADLRYGLRQFRKSPGFAITALLTLALGIGANTAIYSIIHGTLRLPFPQADRMVAIQNVFPQGSYYAASYPDFEDWRSRAHSFSSVVALSPGRVTWIPSGNGKTESEIVNQAMVSDGYFAMNGIHPVLGRGFLSSEHVKGAAPVCVLSEAFWRDELNANAGVLNQPLNLDGKVCTVVGVVPEALPAGNRTPQVWIPLEPNRPWDRRGTNYLFVSGLLRPGVTLQQAQAEVSGIQAQIDKQFPDNKHGIGVHWLSSAYFGDLRSLMNILLAAVGFILLIACVNLANMQLARAADRSREFAVRRALGASPGRMLRQTLTESLLLSLTGAALGLAVAFGLTHIPIAAWPKGMVPPAAVGLDGRILAFTAILGVGTGVLFGMVPGLRVLREDETLALQPGRSVTESREHRRTLGSSGNGGDCDLDAVGSGRGERGAPFRRGSARGLGRASGAHDGHVGVAAGGAVSDAGQPAGFLSHPGAAAGGSAGSDGGGRRRGYTVHGIECEWRFFLRRPAQWDSGPESVCGEARGYARLLRGGGRADPRGPGFQ